MNQPTHRHTRRRRKSPTLPELEQAKAGVLNSLRSLQSRRSYGRAIEEFILWYCSEPRLALNRTVVLRYRLRLENMRLAASTINVRLAAVRRLATEAADSGMLSPDLIAGIRRVRGVKQLGRRLGNWLTPKEGQRLLSAVSTDTLRGKRDAAMLGLLIGCGLRRSELVELDVDRIQQREQRWVILDLIGKGGRVRTVPMPGWVKDAIDEWVCSAEITAGRLFRAIRKNGVLWGHGLTQNVVWYVVKQCARRAGIQKLSPHDLRRSCARMCHEAGGELEQIQFLLGHASVLTTERYIGCKQRLSHAVNDRIALRAVNGTNRDLPEPTGQENGVVSGDIGEGSDEGKVSRDGSQAPSGLARDTALVDAVRVTDRATMSPSAQRRIPRRPATTTRESEPLVSERADGSQRHLEKME